MPDIQTKEQYEQYKADVSQFLSDEGLSFLSTSCHDYDSCEAGDEGHDWRECHGEPWFSWSPCECCGCTLGGTRQYLHARDRQDELVQFTICEDCVYYIEYGRLDDQTMQRIAA